MSTMNKLKEGLHLGKSAGPGAKSGAGTGQPTVGPGTAPAKDEQTFNILPHPAKTNDPADLNQGHTGELRDSGWGAFMAPPGPVIPDEANIPAAATKAELQARQGELNARR